MLVFISGVWCLCFTCLYVNCGCCVAIGISVVSVLVFCGLILMVEVLVCFVLVDDLLFLWLINFFGEFCNWLGLSVIWFWVGCYRFWLIVWLFVCLGFALMLCSFACIAMLCGVVGLGFWFVCWLFAFRLAGFDVAAAFTEYLEYCVGRFLGLDLMIRCICGFPRFSGFLILDHLFLSLGWSVVGFGYFVGLVRRGFWFRCEVWVCFGKILVWVCYWYLPWFCVYLGFGFGVWGVSDLLFRDLLFTSGVFWICWCPGFPWLCGFARLWWVLLPTCPFLFPVGLV